MFYALVASHTGMASKDQIYIQIVEMCYIFKAWRELNRK